MKITGFADNRRREQEIGLPDGYARRVKWLPQIGDLFPDFSIKTTQGPLRYFDWAEGHWTVLFSHPAAYTPVCTTELASLADAQPDFRARDVKLLGFTVSPLQVQQDWHEEIARLFGVSVDFPCAEDLDGSFARVLGMLHGRESGVLPIRKTFIVDPNMRIRAILEYPIFIGRSTDELLRVLDALQLQDSLGLATPADWIDGDTLLLPANISDEESISRYGQAPDRLTPYLHTIEVARTPHFEPMQPSGRLDQEQVRPLRSTIPIQ